MTKGRPVPALLTTTSGSAEAGAPQPWVKSSCIICEPNCGVEIRLDGRNFARIRGNKAHVSSKGYTCEKALRLDHYQNHGDRLTSPLRRRRDGTYEEVSWERAISEVASRLAHVRDTHGGESIFYYGGGGQGNHLGGAYAGALRSALGVRYRSNAIAQEKTGEAYVDARMYRGHTRGEFEHAEVAVFLGKNPWHSHGFPRARKVLKEMRADPDRSIVVLDPRRTETAALADHHLQVFPGTDAFCLAAMLAIIVRDGLVDSQFLENHVRDWEPVLEVLSEVPIKAYADRCDLPVEDIEAAAHRIGRAASIAVFEDLGVEQGPHSTLVSYLHKLLWMLTGNFAKPGAQYLHTALAPIGGGGGRSARPKTSPVTGAAVIAGLIPCNSIADEILTDHPNRFRAMIIESANPAHSLTDSSRFRKALAALDFSIVIDVAMTETARHADYVLPAASQYEKPEAIFFNFEFPDNVFSLRKPILEPLPGTLPEPEIHSRLLEALGVIDDETLAPVREAASQGRSEFAGAYATLLSERPDLASVASAVLHRVLGPSLPEGLESAALLWGLAMQCAGRYPDAVRRAGISQEDSASLGDALFDAILASDDGVVFTSHDRDEAWDLLRTDDRKRNAHIPALLEQLVALPTAPFRYTSTEYPFVLSCGERRSFTANTIFRDPAWRKKDAEGALRMSEVDAQRMGAKSGDFARVETAAGAATVRLEVNDSMREGHLSLPNGLGLDFADGCDETTRVGVAVNELTSIGWEDDVAGTPWHKHVPTSVERVSG